jgi:hypothetical protein
MKISVRAANSARIVAIVAAMAGTAIAAPDKVAQQTFDHGRDLMTEKKFAEACAAFEQSQRLDPQFGTQFNLAGCYVELGKLATAWNLYRELARSDTKAKRRQASSDLAAKLEPRVPRLIVNIQPRPPGLQLAVDGEDSSSLVGVEVHVDLGDHDVVATAPGFGDVKRKVHISREGQLVTEAIALEPATAPTVRADPAGAGAAGTATGDGDTAVRVVVAPQNPNRLLIGKLLVLGGGALFAGGLVTGGIAVSEYHSAESCTTCDKQSQSHHAVVLGDVSTVLVVAGAIPAGFGLYLWKTARSNGHLTADLDTSHALVGVAGNF